MIEFGFEYTKCRSVHINLGIFNNCQKSPMSNK